MSNECDEDDPLVNRNRAADLERIKQARKKRISQLKSWQQYDKLMEKNKTKIDKPNKSNFLKRKIRFPQSLVLLEAAGRGDIDEVTQILVDGGDPNVSNDDGLTALHQCCIDNNVEICRLLLKHKANVNSVDSELWTPLHAAGACAYIEICAALIDSGADLLALNADGNMPYDICEDEDTLDLIERAMASREITQEDIDERRKKPELDMLHAIQSADVDLSKLDKQGASFLHIAASCGYSEVGRFLLDCGIAVDILDKDGWQPLHVAACWGQLEFIELLLLRGANINSTTTGGETVFEICEDTEINEKLLAMKEEIERQHAIKKTRELRPMMSNLNRRSTSSKRSASIRRTSIREKSLLSWKEARQEALIREVVEKQIVQDTASEPNNGSNQNRVSGDGVTHMNTDEIDISQILPDVQMVTENELARKEPFVRRGSSRNSFTHLHPYHSPSRDPSLMEMSVDEESALDVEDAVGKVDKPDKGQPSVPMPTNPVRASQRNGKNQYAMPPSVPSGLAKKPIPTPPQQVQNSSFIRSCDPNMSVKSTTRPVTVPSSAASSTTTAQPPPVRPPKKEIDNGPLKSQKTQGCCVVM